MRESVHNARLKDAEHFQRWRVLIVVGTVICLVASALGIFWMHGWLVQQFTRLEWWRLVAIFVSEIIALFWLGHFLVVYCFRGRSLETKVLHPNLRWVAWGAFVLSTLGGWALDMGISFHLMVSSRQRYKEARPVEVTVRSVTRRRKQAFAMRTYYDLNGRFVADSGTYPFRVELYDDPRPEHRPKLPGEAEMLERVKTSAVPFSLPIRYTPDNPREYWLEVGYWGEPDAELAQFSIVFGFVQFFALIGIVIFSMKNWVGERKAYLPWWTRVTGFVPMLLEGLALFAMGLGALPP